MNTNKILSAIEDIVSDDFCHDLEYDLIAGNIEDEYLRICAEKIGEVYKLAHAYNTDHSCYKVHKDWRIL